MANIYTEVAKAIEARIKDIQWPTAHDPSGATMVGFATTGRRVRLFTDNIEQPAMYVTRNRNFVDEVTNRPDIEDIQFNIIIYHKTAKESENTIPADETNAIYDAVKNALAAKVYDVGYPQRNTLGELVHKCAVKGDVILDDGDIDGQGLLIIPVLVKLT